MWKKQSFSSVNRELQASVFADTVARIGFENVQEQLLSDDLLARIEENIKAQKHLKGGATC